MEQKQIEKRQEARKAYFTCLLSLGFTFKVINDFFYFVAEEFTTIKELVNSVSGGVYSWHGAPYSCGVEKTIARLERELLNEEAGFIAAMTVRPDITVGEIERIDIATIADENDVKKMMAISFAVAFFLGNDDNKNVDTCRRCLKYWRGVLEAHRVKLSIDGKGNYNYEIREADRFLKALECVLTPTPSNTAWPVKKRKQRVKK